MPDDQFWRTFFENRGREPLHWQFRAYGLKRAADVLWGEFEKSEQVIKDRAELPWHVVNPEEQDVISGILVYPMAMLLDGLAFENLLKGILVARDQNLIRDGKIAESISRGHNLGCLFRKANITLDGSEKELSDRCNAFITWAGRYPIPKKYAGYQPGESLPHIARSRIDQLYERVSELLKKEIEREQRK